MKVLKNKEQWTDMLLILVGSFMFSFGVNIVITPLELYNGGFMGVAQLIRTGLFSAFDFSFLHQVDIAGIIYYIINIPIFYWAYKAVGKRFCLRSLIAVTIQTIFMTLIPIPKEPILSDPLVGCIIGGLIGGTGVGLLLRAHSSGGGQDIIGVIFSKKYPGVSVGKMAILTNIFVYAICLIMFDLEITVYSLIYTTVFALICDRVHVQNINMSVMIFTKQDGIEDIIMREMVRGVTKWEGVGAYTKETSNILYIMISKYEVDKLKEIVHRVDPQAFIIFNEGSRVIGNFEKRL